MPVLVIDVASSVAVPAGPTRDVTAVLATAFVPPVPTLIPPPPPLLMVAVAALASSASTVSPPTLSTAASSTNARTFTAVEVVPISARARKTPTATSPPVPPPDVAFAVEAALARTVVRRVVVICACLPMLASTSPVMVAIASTFVTPTMPPEPAEISASAVRVVCSVPSSVWTVSAPAWTTTPSATDAFVAAAICAVPSTFVTATPIVPLPPAR